MTVCKSILILLGIIMQIGVTIGEVIGPWTHTKIAITKLWLSGPIISKFTFSALRCCHPFSPPHRCFIINVLVRRVTSFWCSSSHPLTFEHVSSVIMHLLCSIFLFFDQRYPNNHERSARPSSWAASFLFPFFLKNVYRILRQGADFAYLAQQSP